MVDPGALFRAVCLVLAGSSLPVLAADARPAEAQNPVYGELLYAYLLNDAYQVLTLKAAADLQGGISGHGAYPDLLEGAMAMNFGMPRKASTRFAKLLESGVSARTRDQVWFFLGKQAFLEQDNPAARRAFAQINAPRFEVDNPEDYRESLYLQGLLALRSENVEEALALQAKLDPASPWSVYLDYSLALQHADALPEAIAEIRARLATVALPVAEQRGLSDWLRVAEGSYYLDTQDYPAALTVLRGVSLDGPLAEQALYGLALAALSLKDYPLALSALGELADREAFSDWDLQAPYARAWVLEQVPDPAAALTAYATAADQYQKLGAELDARLTRLDEEDISDWTRGLDMQGSQRDPYGRLKLQPADYAFSSLVASESFQIAARNLADLQSLEDEMGIWKKRLQALSENAAAASAKPEIDDMQSKIMRLGPQIQAVRAEIRSEIKARLREYLQQQNQVVRDYRLASQQARTRLLDEAFRRQAPGGVQ